jgi:hypothetical protein
VSSDELVPAAEAVWHMADIHIQHQLAGLDHAADIGTGVPLNPGADLGGVGGGA